LYAPEQHLFMPLELILCHSLHKSSVVNTDTGNLWYLLTWKVRVLTPFYVLITKFEQGSICCNYGSKGNGGFGFDCIVIPGVAKTTSAKLVNNAICGNIGILTGASVIKTVFSWLLMLWQKSPIVCTIREFTAY
jgi:hypothetical protein